MGTLNDPAAWTDSALGSIPASVELKLVDCPELNYYTSTKPAQGELWIRGGAVTEGYLDMDKTQAKDFVDGWFNTGDIGEFGADGMLRIIDRRKNLVKTLNGEYIALEKVYLFSPLYLSSFCAMGYQRKRVLTYSQRGSSNQSTALPL